jgi:hypothetical protein
MRFEGAPQLLTQVMGAVYHTLILTHEARCITNIPGTASCTALVPGLSQTLWLRMSELLPVFVHNHVCYGGLIQLHVVFKQSLMLKYL